MEVGSSGEGAAGDVFEAGVLVGCEEVDQFLRPVRRGGPVVSGESLELVLVGEDVSSRDDAPFDVVGDQLQQLVHVLCEEQVKVFGCSSR